MGPPDIDQIITPGIQQQVVPSASSPGASSTGVQLFEEPGKLSWENDVWPLVWRMNRNYLDAWQGLGGENQLREWQEALRPRGTWKDSPWLGWGQGEQWGMGRRVGVGPDDQGLVDPVKDGGVWSWAARSFGHDLSKGMTASDWFLLVITYAAVWRADSEGSSSPCSSGPEKLERGWQVQGWFKR